jgi:hypothetical protein
MGCQTLSSRKLFTALLTGEVTVFLMFQKDRHAVKFFVAVVAEGFEVDRFFFFAAHFLLIIKMD